jgi:hypothetical protein
VKPYIKLSSKTIYEEKKEKIDSKMKQKLSIKMIHLPKSSISPRPPVYPGAFPRADQHPPPVNVSQANIMP